MFFAAIPADVEGDGLIVIGLSDAESKSLYDPNAGGPVQRFKLATAIVAGGINKNWNLAVIQANTGEDLRAKLREMLKGAGIRDEQIKEIDLRGNFH